VHYLDTVVRRRPSGRSETLLEGARRRCNRDEDLFAEAKKRSISLRAYFEAPGKDPVPRH